MLLNFIFLNSSTSSTSLSEIFTSDKIAGYITSIDQGVEFDQIGLSLYGLFATLCGLVVIFHISFIAVKNLLSAGEGFNFNEFRKPAFILIMISLWGATDEFIRDTTTKAMVSFVEEKQEKLTQASEDIYNGFFTAKEQQEQKIRKLKEKQVESSLFDSFQEMAINLQALPDRMYESILSFFFGTLKTLDFFLFTVFKIVANVWLKLVGIGGAIAFTVSVFSGGWTPVINWAKTYISVSLWVPVAGIVINMINTIGTKMMGDMVTHFKSTKLETTADFYIAMNNYIPLLLMALGVAIIIFACKLILLMKVPAMISGWISGGSSASGGFAAAFIPVSMVKTVATTAVGAAIGGPAGAGIGASIGGGSGSGGIKGG